MSGMRCTREKCPIKELTDGAIICTAHDCSCRTEPMTNADRIRAMSDEELARQFGAQCPKKSKRVCDKRCHLCWLEWLQQPAEEGDSCDNQIHTGYCLWHPCEQKDGAK